MGGTICPTHEAHVCNSVMQFAMVSGSPQIFSGGFLYSEYSAYLSRV